jgi:hypothetical protein
MDVVPASNIHEHLGPVVPVDNDGHALPKKVTLQVPSRKPSVSSADAGFSSPELGGSEHQLIGSSDEHHILTTPGGQRAAKVAAAKRTPPRFSLLVNEYVGACFEDNCNIGTYIS